MRIVLFYHSLVSDWNHGNAHFLRGLVAELHCRGHQVVVYEPADGWSRQNLLADYGPEAVERFYSVFPQLRSVSYDPATLDLDETLDGAGLVLVHEWNDHELVRRLGGHRARHNSYRLLFHDTHHRAVTDRAAMAAYDLQHYDGVLAFGEIVREIYLQEGWTQRAWTWHEAADTRAFRPIYGQPERGDLVWIGNWGDEERTTELHEFLIEPVRALQLKATVHGVRYPPAARQRLAATGIHYAGWLPNYEVPQVFAGYRATLHIPRRPYVESLPGIPTIRPFEALACGIPLISAPWEDREGLFTPGKDYLVARDGREMKRLLRDVLNDDDLAEALRRQGRATILERHTCAHRVDELLDIYGMLAPPAQQSQTVRAVRRQEKATV
jgi:spore maturation protein CgeB